LYISIQYNKGSFRGSARLAQCIKQGFVEVEDREWAKFATAFDSLKKK
jgi:hypothetical protein